MSTKDTKKKEKKRKEKKRKEKKKVESNKDVHLTGKGQIKNINHCTTAYNCLLPETWHAFPFNQIT
jgi:hypothetical protein